MAVAPSPSRGILLIADISGYTAFLRDSELAHAQGILGDLLEVLVDGTRPPLTVSRLEGDAVFSYTLDVDAIAGQTFVEMVEAIYVAFRRTLEMLLANTRCSCNACARMGNLDLKLFVHVGEFFVQKVGEYRELVGTDVNLAHRLTKNTVVEATGVSAYALYSQAAVEGLGIHHLTEGWISHHESYDAGDVAVWVADLAPVWDAARTRSVIEIRDDEYKGRESVEIALPVEAVWARLTDPEYRRMLIGSDRQVKKGRAGRLGEGDVYLCYHGDTVVTSAILEWLPFSRLITKDLVHVPGSTVYLLVDYLLEPTAGGTRLTMGAARPTGPKLGRAVLPTVAPKLMAAVRAALQAFKERVEADTELISY